MSLRARATHSFNDCWQRLVAECDWLPLLEEIDAYWQAYGRWKAVSRSFWLWLSFLFTIILHPVWKNEDWTSIATGAIPNLLGFSIGAMAIALAFPSSTVFKFLAERGRPDSYYIEVSARFLHFIVVQIVSFVSALLCKSYPCIAFDFFGFWMFVYALFTGLATGFSLFGIAQIYNRSAKSDRADNSKTSNDNDIGTEEK